MGMIEVGDYVQEEKLVIAQTYLIPQAPDKSGLKAHQLKISDEALTRLVRQYCRESGVRALQKCIEKIHRKVAFKIIEDQKEVIEVSLDNLKEFVGKLKFLPERLYEETPAGVVMGLAWTGMGGASFFIESILRKPLERESKEGSIELTGHLGDVMKESCRILHTVAKISMMRTVPSNHFLDKGHLHVHVPEGATPKMG